MKKPEMLVVRFETEDVIATSGAPRLYPFGIEENRITLSSEVKQDNPYWDASIKWAYGEFKTQKFDGAISDDVILNPYFSEFQQYLYIWFDENKKGWYTEDKKWIDYYNDNQNFRTQ